MKKLVIVLSCVFCLNAFSFCNTFDNTFNDYVIQREQNRSAEKIATGICIVLDTGLTIWGFSQKNTYGYITGSFFLLRGIVRIAF